MKYSIVVVLLLSLCIAFVASKTKLELLSQFKYKQNNLYFINTCQYDHEPCALLNDVWGYEYTTEEGKPEYIAVVGLANGLDFINVTDPTNPTRIKYIEGCIDLWRDMKVWGDVVYGITEYTPTCNCPEGEACLEHIDVNSPPSVQGQYPSQEGRLTVQLNVTGPITGTLVPVTPWEDGACSEIANINDINGNIALIQALEDCSFETKIMNAQAANATAVVIIDYTNRVIYPAMTGNGAGINIPGVLIGYDDGQKLRNASLAGNTVEVTLTSQNKQVSPYFRPPEGLTIVSMSNPKNITLVKRMTDHFKFAHNLFVEFTRPHLYTCGMSDQSPDKSGFGDISNGGIFSYDLTSDPLNPTLLGVWNTTYIHDLMVRQCDGSYVLFGADIYKDDLYILNVTDPSNMTTLVNWAGKQLYAHNIWVDDSCNVMYVTHETNYRPITVWSLIRGNDGKIIWEKAPIFRGTIAINQFNGTLPHNVHVNGNELWASYYSEGVAAWNITDPFYPNLIDQYDTSPYYGGQFGVWGVYPFASSGNVYASDMTEGLFVLRLTDDSHASSSSNTDGNDGNDGGDGDDDYEQKWKVATAFAVIFGVATGVLLIAGIAVGIFFFKNRNPAGYTEV